MLAVSVEALNAAEVHSGGANPNQGKARVQVHGGYLGYYQS